MLPWAKWGGYWFWNHRLLRQHVAEVFQHGKIRTKWQGFDLFMCLNHHVENGRPVHTWAIEAGDNDWDYPIDVPAEPSSPIVKAHLELLKGNFIEMAFYNANIYQGWWDVARPDRILKDILARTRYSVVVTGAEWDKSLMTTLASIDPKRVFSLAGKTNTRDWFILKKASRGFVGFPSGSGIMSQHFRVPTVMLWGPNPTFTEGMRTCWQRPDMEGIHRPLDIATRTEVVTMNLLSAIDKKKSEQ